MRGPSGELLTMLETVTYALGDYLCQRMVFVGGCSTAVQITDEIMTCAPNRYPSELESGSFLNC